LSYFHDGMIDCSKNRSLQLRTLDLFNFIQIEPI